MNNHVLLQVPFLRKSFLAVTTFVLCSFFMESVHMFAKTVRSVESLSTFFTCQHTTSACMNLKMPCKVCFFEHISTFVTFLLIMRLSTVLGQFGTGFKCFSKRCTDILRHCLDLAKVRAELALYVPKKVRVVLLSKFGRHPPRLFICLLVFDFEKSMRKSAHFEISENAYLWPFGVFVLNVFVVFARRPSAFFHL